jgi:hypothetical protein
MMIRRDVWGLADFLHKYSLYLEKTLKRPPKLHFLEYFAGIEIFWGISGKKQ